jgi:lipoprotein-anchoring transpeptidase ErfK/SrfK
MLDRRIFLLGSAAVLLSPNLALAQRRKYKISPKYEPQRVPFSGYPRGTIVVDARKRILYFVEDGRSATRYIVGVGRAGESFRGAAVVGH